MPVAAKATTLAPANSFAAGASPYGALNMVGNGMGVGGRARPAPDGEQFQYYLEKLFFGLTPPLSRTDRFNQVRGGSYRYRSTYLIRLLWSSNSSPIPARGRKPDIGFRCAKIPDHSAASGGGHRSPRCSVLRAETAPGPGLSWTILA